jgi:hypothetical protein
MLGGGDGFPGFSRFRGGPSLTECLSRSMLGANGSIRVVVRSSISRSFATLALAVAALIYCVIE